MGEMEGPSSRPPQQFSEMFQKFALAFKTKTFELFAEENDDGAAADTDVISLLDSAEEFIPDQKVVVLKPDAAARSPESDLTQALIPSLFATLSSFEASYLQFQTAHVPQLDRSALEQADKSLVSILQKLTEMKNFYRDFKKNPRKGASDFQFPAGSFLEFQVQENQSKLRVLDTIVNSLQSEIDVKDDEVLSLRKKLDKVRVLNTNLSRKLGLKKENMDLGMGVLLTFRVFEAILNDSIKSLRGFSKLFIDLMERAGWDLDKAANSIYPNVSYAKNGHFRYVFLSYVSLGMFRKFDAPDFGLCDNEIICNENGNHSDGNTYLKQLIEHVASNPVEILSKNRKCDFSRFCEKKYEELIHPTMEFSICSSIDEKEKVLDQWKSVGVFYESFVRMASSIWLLHKLAYSFDPVVEIFRLERGVDFSMVYMEDVTGKCCFPMKGRPKVEFTVIPGFKFGGTIVQSQVYLTGLNSSDQ